MRAKQVRQRIWQWRGLWITAPAVAGVVLTIRFTGALQFLEWAALDQFFRWRPIEPPDSHIVIVTIGEADIAKQGWPISDTVLAQALNRIKQQHPRGIGVDLYRDLPIGSGQVELTRVFETTPNLIGIGKVANSPLGATVSPPGVLAQRGQVGASDLVVDSDGKIRRSLLSLKNAQSKTVLTLGAKLALLYLQAEGKTPQANPGQVIRWGKATFVPLGASDGGYVGVDAGGYQILSNFRNPLQGFTKVSLNDVLSGQIPTDLMRDKVVLVGTTAESLGDFFYTAYSSRLDQRSAGVEIHANLVSQILGAVLEGRTLLQVWPDPWEWLWVLLWAGIGAGLGWTLKHPRWTALGVWLAGAGLVGGAYLLFLAGWWIVVVPSLMALVGAAVVSKGYILWENLNASYQALEEYSRTLEQRVEARTLELSQKNTQLEQEIAERERAEAALRKSERQLQNQNTVLIALSRNKALYRGDLNIALREITAAAAYTLDIERASVWLYDETRTKIQCFDLFQRKTGKHSYGLELQVADYPAYFQALQEDWIIAASDARTDPRTRDFLATYLKPYGITALLSMPIRLGGQTMGLLCLEQVGQVRPWTVDEQNFVSSLADLASLAIEAQGRRRTEKALQAAEEKYRSIFEHAMEGIFQVTPEGYYLSANPALARIYGYASPLDLFSQLVNVSQQLYVDSNRWTQLVQLMQEQGRVTGFESQVYCKDGTVIWISENARAVYDDRAQLLYYEGIVEDITQRKQAEAALHLEREKSERLLLNILPQAIAEELKQGRGAIATRFDSVTILFADIVNFTGLATHLPPSELVKILNEIFSAFDQLADRYGLEKIKTIGDAYMVVGGVPAPCADHAEAIAEMAIDMQQEITRFQTNAGELFQLRIGINTGPVVAGVIGIKKFSYDLWGDAVNIASRMESHGIVGKIQVTEATYRLLRHKYQFVERGSIPVKGRGEMLTYLLTGKRGR